MKSTHFVIFTLTFALSGAFVAAQPPGKKAAQVPRLKVSPGGGDEAASRTQKKPTKKPAKPGAGLKLSTDGKKKAVDEAELIKNLSYMQGFGVGKQVANFKDMGIEIDMDVLMRALRDAADGKESSLSDEESQAAAAEISEYVQAKFAAKNKREGEKFLAQNKKEEGVKALPSGLQYKVLKSGRGETPKRSDVVRAHYKGALLNGMEFDSSYRRGQPASFSVSQVIKGWTEALQLMKVGDKWKLFIPADLAYEEKGMQDRQGQMIIPPNAALVFEVELLGIEKGSKVPTLK